MEIKNDGVLGFNKGQKQTSRLYLSSYGYLNVSRIFVVSHKKFYVFKSIKKCFLCFSRRNQLSLFNSVGSLLSLKLFQELVRKCDVGQTVQPICSLIS